MNIQITFHQMHPSDAIKDYCHDKFDKLTKYYDRIESFKVVLEAKKGEQHVAVVLHLPTKKTVKVDVSDRNDMYAAIDAAHDKLERILTDFKEQH